MEEITKKSRNFPKVSSWPVIPESLSESSVLLYSLLIHQDGETSQSFASFDLFSLSLLTLKILLKFNNGGYICSFIHTY